MINQFLKIIGGDTETFKGRPFTFQFYSDQIANIDNLIWVDEHTATRKFLRFCSELPDGEYVIFFHNLEYDLISLFYDRHIIFTGGQFDFEVNGWSIHGLYDKPCFATLHKDNKVIHLRDTAAWYMTKLENLANLFCPGLPKLKAPAGLGEKIFDVEDREFVDYALRDPEIVYHVGKYIVEMQRKYEINLSVSAPHMASKIFCHKYLKESIPLPSKAICYAAVHSYHGGKNNISVPKGFYQNVKLLDIISAYPAAMKKLPSFSKRQLYQRIDSNGPVNHVHWCGIYKVDGEAKECKWPVIFNHDFKPIQGKFTGVWITGIELNEALSKNEIKIDKLYGFYYEAEKDDIPSPFVSFVDEFFELKNKADKEGDKVTREFAKLNLNSLYGKFIEQRGNKREQDWIYNLESATTSIEKKIITGQLFHPFIATLITGIVRSWIHNLEHKYSALHTATDGIFTLSKRVNLQEGLGGLKLEAEGDLLLFRNKLYILYGKKGTLKSSVFKDRFILKYALHGFRGKVFDLEKIFASGSTEYEYKKVNKLKESLRSGLAVNAFETRKASLNLGENDDG